MVAVMKNYKTVEPFNEPSNILNRIDSSSQKTEMADSDRGFLCGLLREHRPKKIVEVGVAEGGTTAVILECIRELNLDCEMYSVDAAENLYYDNTKKVGWVLDTLRESVSSLGCRHTLFTGKILPEVLEEIGTGIDFLILDTMHSIPGENLDFLSAYPYLSKDAVVVLHDVYISNYPWQYRGQVATNALFSTVVADKYYNLDERPDEFLPNIAAFQLNEDTPKYIMDIFAVLWMPWSYVPSGEQLELYGDALKKLGPQCTELYRRTLKDQLYNANAKAKAREVQDLLMTIDLPPYVLLYGKGGRGKALLRLCKKIGINVSAFVVSDGRSTAGDTEGIPVYEYSKIPFEKDSLIIIQSAQSEEISHRLENSDYRVLTLSEEQWSGAFWYGWE